MDKIYIRDLALRCIIGVFPQERRERQDVCINIELACDHRAAAGSDRLTDAVDYKQLKKQIVAFVEASEFNLLETLAEGIAQICLSESRIAAARVCVDKPAALRFARSVAVEVLRERADARGGG